MSDFPFSHEFILLAERLGAKKRPSAATLDPRPPEVGLLADEDHNSVELLAAVTAPARTAAQRQSSLHFVGEAAWSDAAMLTQVRELVLPA